MHFAYKQLAPLVSILMLGSALVACGGDAGGDAPPGSGMPSGHSSTTDATPNNGATTTTVNVVAKDFKFSLDPVEVTTGTIAFAVTNNGTMPHDFALTVNGEEYKTSLLQPGDSGSFTVVLQPGIYKFHCTVPGHDQIGMQGTFSVK